MTLSEADTRAKLIDPALHKRGWNEDFIRREETAAAVEIVNGKPRRRARGKIDYVLRLKVSIDTQPVALALIEAKKESLPPGHGLDQAKGYAECRRMQVRFVFSSNGHLFVEYDDFTGMTSAPPIVKVQVKGVEGNIGDPQVTALYGKVAANEYGLFVTLGGFTNQAKTFARSKSNLRLIDGDELVALVLQHYEQFDSQYKGLLPLKKVYVPEALEQEED